MKRLIEALFLVASLLCLAAVAVLPVYPAQPSPSPRPSRATVAAPGDSRAYWEQVLNESRKATRVEPAREPESQALFWLAVSAANLGRLDESTTSFRQLQKADPDRKVERTIVDECRSLLADNPDDLRTLNGLAFVAYAKADYGQAASFFQQVVRIDPTNPWARNYYGFSLGKGGRVDEAVRVLEEGTRLFPRNEFTHFLLGLAYYEKGHVIKALGELAKAPGAVRYFR